MDTSLLYISYYIICYLYHGKKQHYYNTRTNIQPYFTVIFKKENGLSCKKDEEFCEIIFYKI